MYHTSPLGIPSQKEWPVHFLNLFLPKIGQIVYEDMSEVLGVGSFWENSHFLTFYNAIFVIFSQNKVKKCQFLSPLEMGVKMDDTLRSQNVSPLKLSVAALDCCCCTGTPPRALAALDYCCTGTANPPL